MAETVMEQYFRKIVAHLERLREEADAVKRAARLIADHVKQDKIVYVYGPGGHSNLGAQEIFFRAGGLMHISAILDEGTLLSGGGPALYGDRTHPGIRSDRHR